MSRQRVDLKVILLGASAVGKTSLIHRYTNDEFSPTTSTIGASFILKMWREKYAIGIWDTAGQEKYDALSSFYTRGAGGAILVFDITDRETFERLPKYLELVNANVPDCYKILVGSKRDLVDSGEKERQITVKEAEEYAQSIGAGYLECSSKTGLNVSEVFERVLCHFFRENPTPVAAAPPPTATVKVTDSPSSTDSKGPAKTGCC